MLNRLLCRLLGHRWVTVWPAAANARSWTCNVCTRCHDNGWVVP